MPAKAVAIAATPSTPAVAPATRNGEACAGKRPYQMPPAVAPSGKLATAEPWASVPAMTGPSAMAPGVAFWKAMAPVPSAISPVVISAAAARVPAYSVSAASSRARNAGSSGASAAARAGLDEDRLHARVGEDRLGEPVGRGTTRSPSLEGLAQEVGHHPPAQLAGDGGVEEEVAAVERVGGLARRPRPRAAAAPSFSPTCGSARATLAGAFSRSQPSAWPVQPGRAGEREVAVDEGVDPRRGRRRSRSRAASATMASASLRSRLSGADMSPP